MQGEQVIERDWGKMCCGTGGENMSQWGYRDESPSPGGSAGMGFLPSCCDRVEGHTRLVFSGLRRYEDA
jgi:hypothetical protein